MAGHDRDRTTLTAPPAAGDPLVELLRHCHRAELLPLAHVLGIRAEGMGLSRLANACARTLRRRGAQDLGNLFLRRGEGPPYLEVVRALCARHGLPAGGDVETLEARILERWVEGTWVELPEQERERVWRRLDLEGPPPAQGETAIVSARSRLALGARYGVGMMALTALRVAPALLPPLVPLAGCLTVAWLGRARDEVLLPAVLEVGAIRQAVRHRVTIGVVGSPSSGKDACIRALFGIDSGNVDPVAGSTRQVEITRLGDATATYLVNTPGMGDVIEEVTEEARQVLDLIDVFVYVVNAQGGVQARERDDHAAVVARGRPVLVVVNKIDTLRQDDRARYLDDARDKLGVEPEHFVAAACDPLPQLADAPIGVEAVRRWLERQLQAQGKDLRELPWLRDGGAIDAEDGAPRSV